MSNSKYSNNAAYKKAHYLRNQAGLKAVKAAWHGLTTAKVQELAKTAYKAVTWHYRTFTAYEATTLHADLARAFTDLLARHEGNQDAAAWLDTWMADMPATWTAQYPLFIAPASGEVANA